MADKPYTIEQVEDRPVFLITWGANNQFSPVDEAFLADVNGTLDAFGREAAVIMDTAQFTLSIGAVVEQIIGAAGRPNLIPRHPYVKMIVVVTTNRFMHLLVTQLSGRFKETEIQLVRSVEEALVLVGE